MRRSKSLTYPYCFAIRYIAVEKGLTEVVRTLIMECGIGVNEPTTSEISAVTPLHVAVLHGQSHLIPMLIELGADVNLLDQEKHCCPLIAAIILQDEWTVQLLIEAKANANRLSREGRGPMYIAAEKDSASILRMLVEKCDIDVNAPATNEIDKGSPLHVAAMFDNASSVSVLLQMGADMYIKDALGRTAEDIAKNAFSRKAYDVLKNHERMLEMKNYDPTTLNASSICSEKDNSDFEEVSSSADVQSLTSCEETVSREDEESSQCETDYSDAERDSADASKGADDDTN
jgi:Ankyrin repeats (3 copies)/Ankyrin repeat